MNELDRLQSIINTLNKGLVKEEQLAPILARIIKTLTTLDGYAKGVIKKIEDKSEEAINKSAQDTLSSISKFEENLNSITLNLQSDYSVHASKLTATLNDGLNSIKEIIPEETDLSDLEKMIEDEVEELEKEIKLIISDNTSEKIRDKLETLKGDERLDKSAIKGLDEELKRIAEIRSAPVQGGVTNMRIAQAFKFIAHTEEPVGDIDGNNTTYTVKNTIWWIAGFTLNGEQIAELPNFTYAGKTITFASALPAAYSGKDFEIKYIGY